MYIWFEFVLLELWEKRYKKLEIGNSGPKQPGNLDQALLFNLSDTTNQKTMAPRNDNCSFFYWFIPFRSAKMFGLYLEGVLMAYWNRFFEGFGKQLFLSHWVKPRTSKLSTSIIAYNNLPENWHTKIGFLHKEAVLGFSRDHLVSCTLSRRVNLHPLF